MKIVIEPTERAERIKTLEKSLSILKQEFVGLDKIIDELGENISSWYITPEIITRPVIVSLWGMTGTGKSSIVKRLLELLGLERNSMTFDCGECSNDSKDLAGMISDSFGLDKEESIFTRMDGGIIKLDRSVFVFDEFQYARTIDEEGSECVKPSLRPIWSILDSGILHMNENYSWDFSQFCNFFDDLCVFADSHPGIVVKNNVIHGKDDVEAIKKSLGFLHYSNLRKFGEGGEEETDTEDKGPFVLLETGHLRTLVKKLNEVESGLGVNVVEEIIGRTWSLKELTEFIKEKKKLMPVTKKLDCSGSLVIVIGNLDEAFRVSDDLDPDMNADIFCDITSKVTVADIKRAMLKRYRPEQVARLGNNLIKYPTLGKRHFEEIIKNEVLRIIKEFNEKVDPITIKVCEEIYQLLYVEGVFPTQGVRPVFTTINTILTPYLSKILIEKGERDKEVVIGIKDVEKVLTRGFKMEEITIFLTFDGGKSCEYTQRLNLGGVRNPEKRKKRYASSVHEAGHAVVYSFLTGQIPDTIVSVATDHGGFCSTYNKEQEGEIDSKLDLDISTKVGMAGYLAEHHFFEDEMCLLGSGSDIEDSWNYFSTAAYRLGYYNFISYSDRESENTSSGIPGGMDVRASQVDFQIKENWSGLIGETKAIIETEEKLIKELALYLGEYGSMSSETYLRILREHGNQLNEKFMKSRRKETGPEYYQNILRR
jgi:cell division protease FtsH